MKKRNILIGTLFFLGVIIVGFILFANNNSLFKNNNKLAVHTPVRVGKRESKAMIELNFVDLKSAVNNSDIVVDITITSWIGEEKKDFNKTYFTANINACLKGDSPDKIVLFQYGNSEFTMKNYPLFDIGDRMIVFLKEAAGSDYEDAYYLIGEHTSIIDIKMVNKTLYTADRYGMLTEGIIESKLSDDNYNFTTVDTVIQNEFLNQTYLYKQLETNPESMYENFFLYEELINEIKNVTNEGGN